MNGDGKIIPTLITNWICLKTGYPSREKLIELDLDDIAKELRGELINGKKCEDCKEKLFRHRFHGKHGFFQIFFFVNH
jgi:hypothetical protein